MPVLEGRGVSKSFGRRAVLRDASFSFDAGEMALIQGRSGTGKSTLLNIVAGMDAPDAGTVRILDSEITAMDEDARAAFRLHHLGFVFQHFNLIPDLNAWENVALPMRLAGRKGHRERAVALLASLGLSQLSEAFPATLSGGEMQRVAIGRALANDPAVVLADEPTANLDEENARLVMAELERIASGGRLVVVASHDPLLLEARSRRFTLQEGRLASLDGPRAVPDPSPRRPPQARSPSG